MLIAHAANGNYLEASAAARRLRARVDEYGWKVNFGKDYLCLEAGITDQRYNGESNDYREFRVITVGYAPSNMVPILDLLWQVDSGKFGTLRVDDSSAKKSA